MPLGKNMGGPCAREQQIDEAIAAFNANPPVDDYYGRNTPARARRPILATDCDYEIVSVSGVQGMRLPTPNEEV